MVDADPQANLSDTLHDQVGWKEVQKEEFKDKSYMQQLYSNASTEPNAATAEPKYVMQGTTTPYLVSSSIFFDRSLFSHALCCSFTCCIPAVVPCSFLPFLIQSKPTDRTNTRAHMTSMATQPYHIVTIGDSTIDNLIWMDKDPSTNQFPIQDCVVGQLRCENTEVTNLAADGFTSGNVLHGAQPMLSRAAWARSGEPFPSDTTHSGILFPLAELKKVHATKPVTHVVLSVGGNDVRVILQAIHKLPSVVATFQDNYQQICEQIMSTGAKLVLVLQYQVCLTHEHGGYGVYGAMAQIPGPGTGQEKLQMLMETIYAPVIEFAKQNQLVVIDLPRTFDPSNETLYRLQIEPSKAGGALIAQVIHHALNTHDFQGESKLYSQKCGEFRSEENTFELGTWKIVRGESESGGGEGKANNDLLSTAAFQTMSTHVEALPQAVAGLMAMGFDEKKVKKALSLCGNLPQQALELLLEGGGEDLDGDISDIYD